MISLNTQMVFKGEEIATTASDVFYIRDNVIEPGEGVIVVPHPDGMTATMVYLRDGMAVDLPLDNTGLTAPDYLEYTRVDVEL